MRIFFFIPLILGLILPIVSLHTLWSVVETWIIVYAGDILVGGVCCVFFLYDQILRGWSLVDIDFGC